MGFLPVGHTHEDIDRIFCCVSRGIANKTILTIPGMVVIQCMNKFHVYLILYYMHSTHDFHKEDLHSHSRGAGANSHL